MKEVLILPRARKQWTSVIGAIILMLCSTTGVFSDNALHQGFGLASVKSMSISVSGDSYTIDTGLSYVRNIDEKITIQINGAIGGSLGGVSYYYYNLSGDLKWKFYRRTRRSLYGVVSGGLLGMRRGIIPINITLINIGLGIGLSFAITPHVWCALDVKNTYFPIEKIFSFPMPQIAIHYWF